MCTHTCMISGPHIIKNYTIRRILWLSNRNKLATFKSILPNFGVNFFKIVPHCRQTLNQKLIQKCKAINFDTETKYWSKFNSQPDPALKLNWKSHTCFIIYYTNGHNSDCRYKTRCEVNRKQQIQLNLKHRNSIVSKPNWDVRIILHLWDRKPFPFTRLKLQKLQNIWIKIQLG